MSDLNEIGFHTLSDYRVKNASVNSPMYRGELLLTQKCNFNCPYCRSVGEDITTEQAKKVMDLWIAEGLKNIRFSGGEPTLHAGLGYLTEYAKKNKIEGIAISTNGSANPSFYKKLMENGVNDFSISLDACCAEDGDKMAGRKIFDKVVENISWLSKETYVTVGIVLNPDNVGKTEDIIKFADSLGVSDIRVIPAAQEGEVLPRLDIEPYLLEKYPILKYRKENLEKGRQVRGNPEKKCGLVLDDMAIMGNYHYPCIIYMREGGSPIGEVGPNMRKEREEWYRSHDCTRDKICKLNCLDVCVDYNTKFKEINNETTI